jgi:hypothetical protein
VIIGVSPGYAANTTGLPEVPDVVIGAMVDVK